MLLGKLKYSKTGGYLIFKVEIVCLCVRDTHVRVSCSVTLKLAVVAGSAGGQVIAGLMTPILRFAETYPAISAFPSRPTTIF